MVDRDAGCPHLNRNDARCSHRFRLDSLHELFEVCCEGFEGCALYYKLNREHPETQTPMEEGSISSSLIGLTIHGGDPHVRATGS